MGSEVLNKIYNEIHVIDKVNLVTEFNNIIFNYVDEFLVVYEKENYPLVILNLSEDVSSVKIGCLLDICIWSTKDNGTRQAKEIQNWFNSDNERKIEIALSITNVYPLNDFERLKLRLTEIESKFPRLKNLCDFWKPIIQKRIERNEFDESEKKISSRFKKILRSIIGKSKN